jgi:Spy/CpxP family protein refolding chaperone
MIGWAVLTGLAAYVGVKVALRHGRFGHFRRGCGWRHGHHRWGRGEGDFLDDVGDHGEWAREDHWGGPWGGRRGGPMFLRALMYKIGARPEQQDAIRAAVDELRETANGLRGEGRRTRDEIAEAMRKPSFDEVAMGELFARHDAALETLRKAVVGTLAKTHNALDERQRQKLAELIAAGPRAFRRGFDMAGW